MNLLYKIRWIFRAILFKLFCKSVGNLSYIGKPIFINGFRNISIGSRVGIYPGARIECLSYGKLNIQDNVAIGQNFHIVLDRLNLTISKGTVISANVFIANVSHSYAEANKSIREQELTNLETTIGENCFIGYGAVIQPGTKLGNNCIVGANSTLKGTFPNNSVIVGSPGRVIKYYDDIKEEWVSV